MLDDVVDKAAILMVDAGHPIATDDRNRRIRLVSDGAVLPVAAAEDCERRAARRERGLNVIVHALDAGSSHQVNGCRVLRQGARYSPMTVAARLLVSTLAARVTGTPAMVRAIDSSRFDLHADQVASEAPRAVVEFADDHAAETQILETSPKLRSTSTGSRSNRPISPCSPAPPEIWRNAKGPFARGEASGGASAATSALLHV
jgi:hypothetical protein